ncbi:low temperature requirement protein A [Sphaerisporangium sp. B11E5]|uniref:low temperature requirement protein A n=1 Tax=Sphaerisporangium sp. B11E5 TaxID=3153563 RepID=UPI00325D0D93
MSETSTVGRRPVWRVAMVGRDPGEGHRAATPLELLFDLCFVVAVAQAAASLHHALAENHIGAGIAGYAMVFFAVWWAWMNFTWFASAYDTDDVLYRLLALVQIGGVLVLAAGVPRAFETQDFGLVTLGYVVMRLAMVALWLRAAREDPARGRIAYRYAAGITVVQAGWVARQALGESVGPVAFVVLVAAELAVPLWAERSLATTWHSSHIAERYGLLTIIVLGESILSATIAVQAGLDGDATTGAMLTVALSGLVIVFSMWWLYFAHPAEGILTSNRVSFPWGYGHYLIFASAAAVGAGLAVSVDHVSGKAHLGGTAAAASLSVPVAVFVLSLWLVHVRPHRPGPLVTTTFAAAPLLVLAAPFTPFPLPATALVMAVLTVMCGRGTARTP